MLVFFWSLVLPLCLWASLLFVEGAYQVHRSRYQTKWDAIALSVCHQLKNHLQKHTANWNYTIAAHQQIMSARVGVCLAEAGAASIKGGPAGFAARMALCNRQLQAMAKAGKLMMKSQEWDLKSFLIYLAVEYENLRSKNQVEAPHSSNQVSALSASRGLRRVPLSAFHASMESLISLFGPKPEWPRKWAAKSPEFEKIFKSEIEFRPRAWTLNSQVLFKIQKNSSPLEKTFCWIEETREGAKYEVKR